MGILRDIGAPGLIIIVLGALLIFGPKRLPELGESIGKMLSEFKKAVKGAENQDKEDYTLSNKKLCTLEAIVWLARVQSFFIF